MSREQTVLTIRDVGLSSPDSQTCFILILLGRVFSHSFRKHFLRMCCVPGCSKPRDTAVNKRALPSRTFSFSDFLVFPLPFCEE